MRGGPPFSFEVAGAFLANRRPPATRESGRSAGKRFACASVCVYVRTGGVVLSSFISMQMITAGLASRPFNPIAAPPAEANLTTRTASKLPSNTNELNPLPHPPHPRNFGSLFSCVFSAARRVLPVSRDHPGEAGLRCDGHSKRDFGGLSTPLEAA